MKIICDALCRIHGRAVRAAAGVDDAFPVFGGRLAAGTKHLGSRRAATGCPWVAWPAGRTMLPQPTPFFRLSDALLAVNSFVMPLPMA
ncbi:MAG: hypothetical protein C0453_08460 [Comamonadaceae bacterium]|nr:hypothetical protein [Comamonadaceae bacterium]